MELKIILFGQLTDIAGSGVLVIKGVSDTNGLQEQLKQQYPGLAASTYLIAVEKEVVHENTPLNEKNRVALLPPFSGG